MDGFRSIDLIDVSFQSDLFLNVIASEQADEMTPTLMSVISTLANILDVVDDHKVSRRIKLESIRWR